MAHDSYAKGAGGFGSLGDGVSVDFVMANGSRGQRRRLERQLSREKTKQARQGKKKGKK